MSPRVAPVPASSGCASLAPSGCPAVASSGDSGGESPRVASPRPPFSCAGDGFPGCPASLILWRCWRLLPGLPPALALLLRLPVFPPGCPGLRTFRLFRRWIIRVAPESRILSALRVVIPRVAPVPRSSCLASRRFHPGRPGFCAFRLRRRWILGLPRVSHPSAMLLPDSASYPASSFASLASWRFRRVTPASAPSGCARGESPGRPESPSPLALPQLRPQVALSPAATAGSMMNPRLYSNFASAACAADESSRPIRSCTSLPDSGCSFNLILSARYRTSQPQTDFLKPTLHLPAWPELRIQVPTGSPAVWRVGRLDLWMQVQNPLKSVDFTRVGADIGNPC
jgi:hypothetical protein